MKRMQATYMVVRYLPDVPREEFVNVGVVLICPSVGFQGIRVIETFGEGSRAKLLGGEGLFVRHSLTKLRNAITHNQVDDLLGTKLAPEGLLTPSGLSDLQQIYCNNIRFGPSRTAVTENPALTLEKLYQEYVGEQAVKSEPKSITRTIIRRKVNEVFSQQGLFNLGLTEDWRLPLLTEPTVDLAYKNRVWHCYQAISFAGHERLVTTAVNAYRQTARDARDSQTEVRDAQFMVLGHKPSNLFRQASNLEAALIHDGIQVADYRDAPQIAQDIKRHLEAHQLQISN